MELVYRNVSSAVYKGEAAGLVTLGRQRGQGTFSEVAPGSTSGLAGHPGEIFAKAELQVDPIN